MTTPRRSIGRVAAWTAGAVLAGGLATATGVAFAGSSPAAGPASLAAPATSPTSSPGATPPGKDGKAGKDGRTHGRGHWPRVSARTLHGELVVRGKDDKPVTVLVQRGSVTAVSATSVTLRSTDGFVGSYTVGSTSQVRVDGKKAALSGVRAGQDAWVTASRDGSTATVRLLVVRPAR